MTIPVQERIRIRLENRAPSSDVLYFSSPEAVRKMALGYEALLADVYWMRAIQYYGRREKADRRPVRYKNLAPMLDIVSTLDPHMIDVYRAGSVFLSEPDPIGAGKPEEAVRLLDKGIRFNPSQWLLWLDKGFVYYWYAKDYRKAGEAWLAASRLDNAPPWMGGLAAMGLSRGGELDTARMLWKQQAEESSREDVRENARNHLASIEVDETLWTLEFLIEKYREKHGSYPQGLQSLVRPGYLRRVPPDPSGIPYAYEPATGRVMLSPETGVRYLQVPQEYKEPFMERLRRRFEVR